MARTKKNIKGAPNVWICYKVQSGGVKAPYLKWKGDNDKTQIEYCKDESGHNLHIVDKTTPYAKEINAETMKRVNALKANKIIELTTGETKQRVKHRSKILLQEWFKIALTEKLSNGYRGKGLFENVRKALYLFEPNATLGEVDKDFVLRFQSFLKHNKPHRVETHLKTKDPHKGDEVRHICNTTIHNYIVALGTCLNMAVRKEYIESNPVDKIDKADKIKPKQANRGFLTADEVKVLANTECSNNEVKRAFLFSCYCGLRFSDVSKLCTRNIVKIDDKYFADIVITKTGKHENLPLNNKAMAYVDIKAEKDKKIFDLSDNRTCNAILKRWAKSANIDKNISFHTARHTFGTLAITLGVEVYTLSKLMGHADVRTTQIYADVVNERKIKAVALFDNLK